MLTSPSWDVPVCPGSPTSEEHKRVRTNQPHLRNTPVVFCQCQKSQKSLFIDYFVKSQVVCCPPTRSLGENPRSLLKQLLLKLNRATMVISRCGALITSTRTAAFGSRARVAATSLHNLISSLHVGASPHRSLMKLGRPER